MEFNLQTAPTPLRWLTLYLMIGWCTQLPGGLFRRYQPAWMFLDNYERHGARAFLELPFIWIPFTILLWPIPFLRMGVNLPVLVSSGVGVLSYAVLINYVNTLFGASIVVVLAGCVSTYLVRPRGR